MTPRVARSDTAAYEPRDNLRPAVVSGVKWKLSSQLIREGSRLAVGILLARILTPEQWGIAGMALAFAGILQIVSDPVVGYALVQRRTITETDRSTAFWISLVLGLSLATGGIACSGLLADFFGEPSVQGLFAALSVGFLISSLGSVPNALLARELAYRSLELRQIVGTLTGATVALSVAVAGGGPWAIIANSLAAATASTILLWIMTPWRPRFLASRESARNIAGVGMAVLGSQVLLYVQVSVDKVLVGRYLGSTALGNYAFAYSLMFTPIMNVAFPLQGVLFPALATIQHDKERLVAAWLNGKRIVVAVMAPAFAALFVTGPDLVPLVFGAKWEDAVQVLQLLCVAGIGQSLGTFNGLVLIVLGRMRLLLGLMLLIATTTAVSVAVGVYWGILAVAAAYAVAQWALVLPDTWITSRAAGSGLLLTLRTTCVSVPFAFGAATVALGTRWALVEAGAPRSVRVVAVGAVLLATYAPLVWFGSRSLRVEAAAAISRLRRRPQPQRP